ncbi:MAG: hypothetical protein U5L01_13890 [Rheinheimera sp.]|nr:hypothetical protein [Rheinheimera sp.]
MRVILAIYPLALFTVVAEMLESSLKSGCPGLVGQLMSGEYIKMLGHYYGAQSLVVNNSFLGVISGCDAGDEVGRLKYGGDNC